jgi:hypothetical protein
MQVHRMTRLFTAYVAPSLTNILYCMLLLLLATVVVVRGQTSDSGLLRV